MSTFLQLLSLSSNPSACKSRRTGWSKTSSILQQNKQTDFTICQNVVFLNKNDFFGSECSTAAKWRHQGSEVWRESVTRPLVSLVLQGGPKLLALSPRIILLIFGTHHAKDFWTSQLHHVNHMNVMHAFSFFITSL